VLFVQWWGHWMWSCLFSIDAIKVLYVTADVDYMRLADDVVVNLHFKTLVHWFSHGCS